MDEDEIWDIYWDIKLYYTRLNENDKRFIDTFLSFPEYSEANIDRLFNMWMYYCN